jgi:hypothetical protein
MNTFISEKLGEVLAFARMGSDTLEKGTKCFLKMMPKKDFERMEMMFKELGMKVAAIAEEGGVMEDVGKEADKTGEKVTKMRDTYLKGVWDDESDLLEWMGFYTGASLVHWRLIQGAAKKMKFDDLAQVARQAVGFYDALFVSDEATLEKIGAAGVK